mmetsp:Transcript_20289/g.34991  ORF Transcript_20289/g.34991 Transcript_20289/m.34991 type:complete len:249 (-) Transcript_20289:461-1207(-)
MQAATNMHTAEQTPKHFRVEKNMGQISAHGLELVLQPQPQPQRSGDLQCNGCSAVTRNLIRQACTTHVHMPLSTGAHCRVLWGFDHMAPCNLFGLLDLVSIDHLEKIWLHGSTPDKEAIDVRLLCQFITIRSADRSAVDNSDCHGDILAHGLGKPGSQILVHLLGLLWSRHFSSPNSPHGLICNHNVRPISFGQLCVQSGTLSLVNFHGLASFSFRQQLATAKHHLQSLVNGVLAFDSNGLISLFELW